MPSGAACSMTCRARASPWNLRPGAADGDYGQAWLRDYARREGVSVDEMLPTPLRLRREMERLGGPGGRPPRGRAPGGAPPPLTGRRGGRGPPPAPPPIHVRLVNADELVARWRA